MLNEMIIVGSERKPIHTKPPSHTLSFFVRAGWILGKLALVGLVVTYLAGWVQDLQRLTHLAAEPTPPFKVISKYEAWHRVHKSQVR